MRLRELLEHVGCSTRGRWTAVVVEAVAVVAMNGEEEVTTVDTVVTLTDVPTE